MIDTTPTISSIAQFMKLEIKLVGFKYMPFDLKRFCLTIPAEFNSLEMTGDKCFRFIHLVGAHSPWHQDAQMNEIEDDDSSEKRQHPILFVKGVGEHYDELQVSSAPISQSDYLDAYSRLLDGRQGDAIFDYKEGDARERRFLFYDYDEPTHFYEYMQTGYAGNVDTMYFTSVEITP